MRIRVWWSGSFGVGALALATSVIAQTSFDPTAFGTGLLNQQLLQPVDQSRVRAANLYAARPRREIPGGRATRLSDGGRRAASPALGAYRRDPAVSAQVRREYLDFVRRAGGPGDVAKVEQDYRRFDVVRVWGDLVRDNALAPGTVADALAAWTVLNWGMANGADVDAPAARALRAQMAEALGAEPVLASMTERDRQAFSEALMLNYVYQQGAYAHAVRTRDRRLLQTLGDAAERRFRTEMGLSLRSMILSPRGLLPRA